MNMDQTENRPMVFTASCYPKSYGSIKKDDFRLRSFLDLGNGDLSILWKKLGRFCIDRSREIKPRTEYGELEYIGSGWEWSVFRRDENTVVKVPAGVFPEVNDPIYLQNVEFAYSTITSVFPREFVAYSRFYRKEGLNTEEQEFIKGEADAVISFEAQDKKLLRHLRRFLECSLELAEQSEWIPDFRFLKKGSGFLLRNVILEGSTSQMTGYVLA